jgi:hypothetical protein
VTAEHVWVTEKLAIAPPVGIPVTALLKNALDPRQMTGLFALSWIDIDRCGTDKSNRIKTLR